jgi:hypothetical protein
MESFISNCKIIFNLTKDEYFKSIMYWINHGENLNNAIRKGSIRSDSSISSNVEIFQRQRKQYEQYACHLRKLDELLKLSLVKEPIILYRSIWEDLYENLISGGIIEQNTFMSCAGHKFDETFGDIKMIIQVPSGVNAFYISVVDNSEDNTEDEILLAPSKLQYIGKSKDNEYIFNLIETRSLFR